MKFLCKKLQITGGATRLCTLRAVGLKATTSELRADAARFLATSPMKEIRNTKIAVLTQRASTQRP